MSRIGKKPIPVPQGVKVAVASGKIDVQGPKGKLSLAVPRGISFEQKDGVLTAKRESEEHRALHGLARALVANAVHGVTHGFRKEMDIVGVGYRAEVKGSDLHIALGYSHPIVYPLPKGVSASVERQIIITLTSADRRLLGETAAAIRGFRPPEPYKGKGVKYREEVIKRKAGKAVGAAGS